MRTKQTLTLRSYQVPLVDRIVELFKSHDEVCLAAATGSGKTEMALGIVARMCGTGTRALMLAHGTNVVLGNAAARIAKYDLGYSSVVYGSGYEKASKKRRASDSGALEETLMVTIPQAINGNAWVAGKRDLLIIDEAHQFTPDPENEQADEMMVAKISSEIGARKILYVTATPSPFVKRKIPIVAFSLLDALAEGATCDPTICLGSSAYMYDLSRSHTGDGDLSESAGQQMTIAQTNATMLEAQSILVRQLMRKVALEHSYQDRGARELVPSSGAPSAREVWTGAGKTMIVAHNADQAKDIEGNLIQAGVRVVRSDYKNDPNNSEIEKFRTDPLVSVLVVIYRGNLGMDMPELTCVVDMSETKNPNRILQMLGRVVRRAEGDSRKFYIKLVSPRTVEYQEHLLGFVMMLADEETLTTWDGSDPLDIKIPRIESPRMPRAERDDDEPRAATERDMIRKKPAPTLGGIGLTDFFNYYVSRSDPTIDWRYWTTLREVRARMLGDAGIKARRREDDAICRFIGEEGRVPVASDGAIHDSYLKLINDPRHGGRWKNQFYAIRKIALRQQRREA